MIKIKVLELFSGCGILSQSFRNNNHETFEIDLADDVNPDWRVDILNVSAQDIIDRFGYPDVIWASPLCTTHSIASISKHRTRLDNGLLVAKSDKAKEHDKVLIHTLNLIKELNPKYYFIENPRGGMRKSEIMQEWNEKGMYTITYGQYGDDRMKPTDLWSNHPNPNFKPMCKNGDPCHTPAPRGSRTGTQGLKNNRERSKLPKLLCEHIVSICED